MKKTLLAFTMLAAGAALAGARAPKQPNIVFIFSDDHALRAISAYGSNYCRTPNIDRIANEGALFRNSFCANSICGPSRATVFTGKHSHKNGYIHNNIGAFDGSQWTFPKALRKAGYQTAMIGKWHLHSDPTGFDHWDIIDGQGVYYNPTFVTPEGKVQREGYATDIIGDLALDWLENRRDPDKPFYLNFWHKSPHRNFMPALRHLDLYTDTVFPEPPTLFDDYRGRSKATAGHGIGIDRHMMLDADLKITPPLADYPKLQKVAERWMGTMNPEQRKVWDAAYQQRVREFNERNLSGKDLVRWKYQCFMQDYMRCVASLDESVGRMLDWLEKNKLADNTIVIYSSDQGFYLGEHGWFDKRFMYEESMMMPLMIRWPGRIRPKTEITEMVQNIDYAPTLLEALGLPVPAAVQRRSFLPLLEGAKTADWRRSLLYTYYDIHSVPKHIGVRTERYKLIHFFGTDEWELYDLRNDPVEIHNLYADPEYREVRDRLKGELDHLLKKYDVPEKLIKGK
jgi:N-acetylglucosamine-6-sulfatase